MAKRRKRGEGNAHLRNDERWEGRVVIGYDDKGLPITKNVLAKTKTECTDKLKKLRESCNGQPSEKLRPDMLFSDWLDFWYQNYSKPKLRPTTQMGYENTIYKENSPLDPATCRKRLQIILEHAGCKKVSFHALRHTFVSTALESGMDVKTLSTIIGHVSAATTLDIYSHITDEMRRTAAAKIDKGIGKCQPQDKPSSEDERLPTQTPDTHPGAVFEPYKGKRRRAGEGCLSQLNEHLWMGKYSPKWPDGKKHSRSVYASTSEECEEKLAELIQQMKLEIAEAKRFAEEGKWDQVVALAGQKKARGARGTESGHKEKLLRCNHKRTFNRSAVALIRHPAPSWGQGFLSVVKAVVTAKTKNKNQLKSSKNKLKTAENSGF